MFAGVLFHASLAYSPLMHPYWLTADRGQWVGVDVAVWFLHLFRMPLFFVIAGFFAAWQVARRGVGGMLRNRVARILIPLVLFWPLVTGSIGWFTEQAAREVTQASPVLALIREDALPPLPPSLTHLWFLYYLLWFYVLIWVVTAAEWRVDVSRIWTGPALGVVVLAPVLQIAPLVSVTAPTPAPDSFLPQLWALAFYGLFFAFGYNLHEHPHWLVRLRPLAPALGVASLGAYTAFLWVLDARSAEPLLHLGAAALQACVSVWMTLWSLQAGSIWLNMQVGWLRYLSDASYWTYLVHLPVLFAVQYQLLDLELPWPIKWGIGVGVTLAICLGSYHLAVRRTWLGRLLNGKR
jgi:glucan biosynthesis protein C